MFLIPLAAYLAIGLVVAVATRRLAVMHWLAQLFVALDQVLNVLLTPFHSSTWADESLSARAYRAHRDGRWWGWTMVAVDTLFFWQPRHCRGAHFAEMSRRQSPPETR